MNGIYKFTSTSIPSNKKGILKPDSDGYYTLIVGGLNIFNHSNQFYALEGAKELFEESSSLMRRIRGGNLKGELGHPRKDPNMTMENYLNRIYEIRESNVCCHFKDVVLDANYGIKNGMPGVVAVVAKITPAGPHGPALEKALNNPNENVNFSVRGITDDYFDRGRYTRVLKQIICWDWVTEPGISIAQKYNSPAIENSLMLESLVDMTIYENDLKSLLDNKSNISLESSREAIVETLSFFRNKNDVANKLRNW